MTEPAENKKPFVIAIANEKGGVGKTTTTLAVGTILAQRGHKILLLDLDPQGNLALSLGFKPHEMPTPNFALGTAGTMFARDSFRTETENIDLVFARSLIVDDEYQIRVNTGDDAYFLSQDLMILKELPYDFVVIDCPPSMGKIAINTLLIADYLIIPSQAEYFSAFALKNMMELIGIVRQQGNPTLPYRILITMYDRRNNIHRGIRNQLMHTFSSGLFKAVIGVDAELRTVAILGFPTERTHGVQQYNQLVDEVLEEIQHLKPAG